MPWKNQKAQDFLVLSWDIKWQPWPEMGWATSCILNKLRSFQSQILQFTEFLH